MTALPRPRRTPFTAALTGEGSLWRIAGAAMLLASVAGQHPNMLFGRIREKDLFHLVPNWRFFAPIPATTDFHFLYRTVDAGGTASKWHDVSGIEERKPLQFVWFPTRRNEKRIFDACGEILPALEHGFETVTRTVGYRMVTEHLRARLSSRHDMGPEVKGFQFALANGTGYDMRHDPKVIFVSPYVPLDPNAPGTPLTSADSAGRTPGQDPGSQGDGLRHAKAAR